MKRSFNNKEIIIIVLTATEGSLPIIVVALNKVRLPKERIFVKWYRPLWLYSSAPVSPVSLCLNACVLLISVSVLSVRQCSLMFLHHGGIPTTLSTTTTAATVHAQLRVDHRHLSNK